MAGKLTAEALAAIVLPLDRQFHCGASVIVWRWGYWVLCGTHHGVHVSPRLAALVISDCLWRRARTEPLGEAQDRVIAAAVAVDRLLRMN